MYMDEEYDTPENQAKEESRRAVFATANLSLVALGDIARKLDEHGTPYPVAQNTINSLRTRQIRQQPTSFPLPVVTRDGRRPPLWDVEKLLRWRVYVGVQYAGKQKLARERQDIDVV